MQTKRYNWNTRMYIWLFNLEMKEWISARQRQAWSASFLIWSSQNFGNGQALCCFFILMQHNDFGRPLYLYFNSTEFLVIGHQHRFYCVFNLVWTPTHKSQSSSNVPKSPIKIWLVASMLNYHCQNNGKRT